MTETHKDTSMRVERDSQTAAIVREAFESGHSLDRIAETTFERKKSAPVEFIGFAIGMLLTILGVMPVVRYAVEDGGDFPAAIGITMMACGIGVVIVTSVMDARISRNREEAYRAHHDRVRHNLLERFFG